jgi:rubredoxin
MTHIEPNHHAVEVPEDQRCEVCSGAEELIPYQDAAGCGTTIIELWRCTVCGHARYGDIMGYGTCDIDI